MKFLVTKELDQNPFLKLLILFFVAVLTFFLLSDVALHYYQIGLTPTLALEHVLGNEEAFIEPMLFDVLLERLHTDIFTSMTTLTLLVIIYMRLNEKSTNKMIHITFLAAIFAPISLVLGYFYGSIFIMVWIGLFLLWHLCALCFSLLIIWKLLRP